MDISFFVLKIRLYLISKPTVQMNYSSFIFQISRLIVPPPVYLFMLKHPLTKQYDLSFIKEMRSGAAPMGKNVERDLKDQ